jgi:hypothetical protein
MGMFRDELRQIMSWEERHRRLGARLVAILLLTLLIDAAGSVLVYFAERHAPNTDIHGYGDALFFTTVQLLTISSQIRNPFTAWGRVIDVVLEIWGVIVVAGSAGAIASFFQTAD